MKRKFLLNGVAIIIAVLVSLFSASSYAAIVEHSWCTIETPDKVKSNQEVTVNITIKSPDVKPGMKLSCDFHWMKKDGWGGVVGYVFPQTIKQGVKKYTFRTKFKLSPEADHVYPYVFYSKDGNFNNKLANANGNKMMADLTENKPVQTAAGTTVVEYDWCKIEAMPNIEPGKPGVVTVTLKGDTVKPGMKLSCDFHWMKKDGWGGMLGWNPSQEVTADKRVYTFKSNFKTNENMDHFYGFVFFSKDGNFKNKIAEAYGPKTYFDFTKVKPAILEKPATATFKKSWLKVSFDKSVVDVGEEYECVVEYYIDPTDSWGKGTSIRVSPYGPWIDNPDGVYNKHRHHVPYPGLWVQTKQAEVGKVAELRFPQKVKKGYAFNSLLYVATFVDTNGKNWPWDTRAGGPTINQTYEIFSIKSKELGGATWGGATPQVAIRKGTTKPASALSLKLKVTNVEGQVVWTGSKEVSFANSDEIMVSLDGLTTPGVFLIEATDQNGNVRESTIANLPDVRAAIGSGRSVFGVTDIYSKDLSTLAYQLGFSYCRHFVGWNGLEAIRGEYTLDRLDRIVKANNDGGILPWIMLIGPPKWVMTKPDQFGAGFTPFPFDREAWEQTTAHLAKHYKGKIYGFEWLNEIVPGTLCDNPVADYLDFCRIGTEQVRKYAPEMKTMAAGGLWPRNFLLDLLDSGLGEHVDIIPIHYGTRNGVITAQKDLAARGLTNSVIDNETAAGITVFNMPQLVAMTNSLMQCRHVMSRWPAELAAGCEMIVYFGGRGDACGNWSYLLDINTPRPVIASIATVIEKLGTARPVGTYASGSEGFVHVFEKNGRGIVALEPASLEDTLIEIDCVASKVKATDYQGRTVKPVAIAAGKATYKLTNGMAIIVENVPLAVHANRTALEIDGQDAATPQISAVVVAGQEAQVSIKVKNPYESNFSGLVSMVDPATRKSLKSESFSLDVGEVSRITLPMPLGRDSAIVVLNSTKASKKAINTTTKINIVAIDPSQLGNLVKNGAMNGNVGQKPASWSGNGVVEKAPGFSLGTAMKLSGENWQHAIQKVGIKVPGKKYLYTAWVKNMDYDAGSNLSYEYSDGTPSKTLYMPHVFSAGRITDGWRFMSKVMDTSANVKQVSPTPVGRGKGKVYFDNVRVTQYSGTEYCSEALKVAQNNSINIDGNLNEWELDKLEPIPLLCDNQIVKSAGYNWTEDSLAGVGYLRWDSSALYLAVQVQDDKHIADQTGDDALKCDAIELALHPLNRIDGEDARAFEWFISAASPGGGSGKHTIYRNPKHSGGLAAGQLAKDSSLYDIVVTRKGNITTYEVKIPWSETAMPNHVLGTRFGLSIGLYDCDTPNGPVGKMIWGGGISPKWMPTSFGEITLIE